MLDQCHTSLARILKPMAFWVYETLRKRVGLYRLQTVCVHGKCEVAKETHRWLRLDMSVQVCYGRIEL